MKQVLNWKISCKIELMSEKRTRPQDVSVGMVRIGERDVHVKQSDAIVQYESRHERYDHILILPEREDGEPLRYFPEDHQEIYGWIGTGIRLVVSCEADEATQQAYAEQALIPEGVDASVDDMMQGFDDLLGRS
jgi:hypothetical protein